MKQDSGIKGLAGGLKNRRIPLNWVIIAIVLIVLIIIPFALKGEPYYVHIFVMIFLMGYLATAWGLVGQSGQLSFGHAAFFGLGAYTSSTLYMDVGISPWIGMFVGAIVAVIAGLIIGYPTLRLRGPYFALATLAFCAILQIYVRNTPILGPLHLGAAWGITISPYLTGQGPAFFQFASKTPFYFISLAMLAGIVYFSYQLNRTRLGYYWLAIRGNQDAAESLGINAGRYRLTAFLMSCALSALGGTFYAQYYYFITPFRVLDISLSLEIALMGVVGGWQSIFGPMLGAFILVPISELVRAELGSVAMGLHLVIYGIIFVLIILFLPKGVNEPFMRGLRWLDTRHWRPSRNANNDKLGRQ